MALKRGGLGRGLDSLIPDKKKEQTAKQSASSKDEVKAAKKTSGKKAGTKKKKKPEDENDTAAQSKKGKPSDESANESVLSENETRKADEINIEAGNETGASDLTQASQADQGETMSEEIKSSVQESDEMQAAASEAGIDSDSEGSVGTPETAYDLSDDGISSEESVQKPIFPDESKEKVLLININLVEPNREQPRKKFREEGIEELASSISQYGIIQPLLVQKRNDYYEIIAGERRWRAARKAGLKEVPVILKDYSDKEAVEISLIENIQREDLNPIEEALAYERLINEFEMTQEQVAGRVSKSRSAVTNSLRLLKLEADIRGMLISGELSEGHARAILGLPDPDAQKALAERVVKEKLSVRETEKIVKKLMSQIVRKTKKRDYEKEAILSNLSEQLKTILGTKVSIHEGARHKGKIEIEYYSDDELNRIFEMLQTLK